MGSTQSFCHTLQHAESSFTRLVDIAKTDLFKGHQDTSQKLVPRRIDLMTLLSHYTALEMYPICIDHIPTLYLLDANRDGWISWEDVQNFLHWCTRCVDVTEDASTETPAALASRSLVGQTYCDFIRAAAVLHFSSLVQQGPYGDGLSELMKWLLLLVENVYPSRTVSGHNGLTTARAQNFEDSNADRMQDSLQGEVPPSTDLKETASIAASRDLFRSSEKEIGVVDANWHSTHTSQPSEATGGSRNSARSVSRKKVFDEISPKDPLPLFSRESTVVNDQDSDSYDQDLYALECALHRKEDDMSYMDMRAIYLLERLLDAQLQCRRIADECDQSGVESLLPSLRSAVVSMNTARSSGFVQQVARRMVCTPGGKNDYSFVIDGFGDSLDKYMDIDGSEVSELQASSYVHRHIVEDVLIVYLNELLCEYRIMSGFFENSTPS